jgi:hypothetical protein
MRDLSPCLSMIPSFMMIILSTLIVSNRWKLCVISIIVLPASCHVSICWRSMSIASMSNPESTSSSMITDGSRSAICRSSIRRFSPPENPTKRSRSRNVGSSQSDGSIFSIIRRNTNGDGNLVSICWRAK